MSSPTRIHELYAYPIQLKIILLYRVYVFFSPILIKKENNNKSRKKGTTDVSILHLSFSLAGIRAF